MNTNAVSGPSPKRDKSIRVFVHGLVVAGISLESFWFEEEWFWEGFFVMVNAMDQDAD